MRSLGPVPAAAVWVASTDADTVVPPGWLVQQVGAADAGAHFARVHINGEDGDLRVALQACGTPMRQSLKIAL